MALNALYDLNNHGCDCVYAGANTVVMNGLQDGLYLALGLYLYGEITVALLNGEDVVYREDLGYPENKVFNTLEEVIQEFQRLQALLSDANTDADADADVDANTDADADADADAKADANAGAGVSKDNSE